MDKHLGTVMGSLDHKVAVMIFNTLGTGGAQIVDADGNTIVDQEIVMELTNCPGTGIDTDT